MAVNEYAERLPKPTGSGGGSAIGRSVGRSVGRLVGLSLLVSVSVSAGRFGSPRATSPPWPGRCLFDGTSKESAQKQAEQRPEEAVEAQCE